LDLKTERRERSKKLAIREKGSSIIFFENFISEDTDRASLAFR